MPLTVPYVPTGIKTGVSIVEVLVVSAPLLAKPDVWDTLNVIFLLSSHLRN